MDKNKSLEELKQDLVSEIEKRVEDKIIEQANADLLIKLINNAETETEAMDIAALGTTYKRTGFHFDKRLEAISDKIRYKTKNKKLSFVNDSSHLTHELIIGDNYEALQNLLITHKGKIDVIYIDPPYGKDKMGDFAKTNYENAITRDNLLSMLYPRLLMAKRLLTSEGVIFCSIDDKNQAYVKCLFDEVFGEENFVAIFDWRKKTGANDAKDIAVITESILLYAKSKSTCIEQEIWARDEDSINKDRYKYEDEFVEERGRFYYDTLDRGGLQYSDSMNYGIKMPDGTMLFPNGRSKFENDGWIWKWGLEKVKWGLENKFLEYCKSSKNTHTAYTIKYKVYEFVDNEGNIRDKKGRAYMNLITEPINQQGNAEMMEIFEHKIFSNPKPIGLIRYLIKTIKTKSITVLDFFAGSGTTGQAVMELNKEDGGNRTFILCTNNEKTENTPNGIAYDVTTKRLKRVMSGKCYDGTNDFPWLKGHKPYMDNLNVYEIAEVSKTAHKAGETAFDKIDETCYGLPKFVKLTDKIAWICNNFENATKFIEKKEGE